MDLQNKNHNFLYWILGNFICKLGIAMTTKSSFGLSMTAATPYILNYCFGERVPWLTQGTLEYMFQAVLLMIACLIIHKFEWKYLLTFAEAVFAGLILDGWFFIMGGNGPAETLISRILLYAFGLFVTDLGIAFFFRTTWPVQAYDFVVMSIADCYNMPKSRIKFLHDMILLIFALLLSLILTHRLVGIGVGTVITAVFNAPIIAMWGRLIDHLKI